MQNKANSGRSPVDGARGTGAKCAKRTQFGPGGREGARVAGRPRRDTTAPNKANFRRRNGRGKCLAGKKLWYIVPAIGFGKTKPNLGELGHLGKGEGRGAIVRNKANFRQAGHGPGIPAWSRAPVGSGLRCGGAQIPCRGGGGLYNGWPQRQLDGSGLCVREAGLSWCER
jgi:hypothetical protein